MSDFVNDGRPHGWTDNDMADWAAKSNRGQGYNEGFTAGALEALDKIEIVAKAFGGITAAHIANCIEDIRQQYKV